MTRNVAISMLPGVDDDAALRSLPVAYATALRLRAGGADDSLIARTLEVELDELPLLMQLAQAKLDRARTLVHADGAVAMRRLHEEDP